MVTSMIRFANHSPHRFRGWVRRNIDRVPTLRAGTVGGVQYVLGERTGEDTYACHFHVDLSPGERREVNLFNAMPSSWELAPPNPLSWFGGPLKLNGEKLQVQSILIDGASWIVHMRGRTGATLVHEIWVRQYPGEPWVTGRILTVASNPDTELMVEDVPDIQLQFGSGITFVEGKEWHEPLSYGREQADGQGFALPFSVLWREHVTEATEIPSFEALHKGQIGCVGIRDLHPDGNQVYPANFDPVKWSRQHWIGAVAALHDWRAPVLGIAPQSTVTGAQEDQLFAGGESMLPGGVGAEHVNYLAALKWAQRPCHYYEADGSPIDVRNHPGLVIWEGRPHRIGTDMLGKTDQIGPASGWYGPDRQHWLVSRLAAANRIYGDPLTNRLLEHQAQLFLASETLDPGLSTSHSDSARSVGYAGMVAVALWRGLRNRELADRVRERMVDRIHQVYLPELSGRPGGLWDVRADDRIFVDFDREIKDRTWDDALDLLEPDPGTAPVIAQIAGQRGTVAHLARQLELMGFTIEADLIQHLVEYLIENSYAAGAMLWQQSLGAYGLNLASRLFGVPEGRELALAAAKAVMAHGWRKHDGVWKFWENVGWLGGQILDDSEYVEGRGAHRTGWFDSTWAVPGLATILMSEPDNQQAREIWQQVASNGGSWVPPGVPA